MAISISPDNWAVLAINCDPHESPVGHAAGFDDDLSGWQAGKPSKLQSYMYIWNSAHENPGRRKSQFLGSGQMLLRHSLSYVFSHKFLMHSQPMLQHVCTKWCGRQRVGKLVGKCSENGGRSLGWHEVSVLG